MSHFCNRASSGDFQNVMKFPLLIAQCLGLLPVAGVLGNDVSKVRFSVASGKFVYSFILCVITGIVFCFCCYRLFIISFTYDLISFVVFYGTSWFTVVMFMKIATRWSFMVREISSLECEYPTAETDLKSRCNRSCIVILFLATLEHVLSLIARYAKIIDCFPDERDIYETYLQSNFPWLTEFKLPHFLPIAILLQIIIISTTMIWNYSDMFVICVSLYLTSRFEQLNRTLFAARGMYLPPSFWRRAREEYTNASALVALVDDVINGVIFVGTASNLFFICVQLFNCLANGVSNGVDIKVCPNHPSGPFGGREQAVYFVFSLSFLLARSLAVSLAAARVHAASAAPAHVLHEVPAAVYCAEVERLLQQLQGNHVALTGLKFYKITKALILSVAGSIVTYELVLLQFDN